MPELPEVETVAEALRRNLVGRLLTGLQVRFKGILSDSPRLVRKTLLGKTLSGVHRHGKYLILAFGRQSTGKGPGPARGGTGTRTHGSQVAAETTGGNYGDANWMVHLRMTGQIFIEEDYRPDKHVHLVLDFAGARIYYRDIRKFGRFTLVEDPRRPAALSHIGTDMLKIPFAEWSSRIASRRAPLKALLLDQGIAAGLGNIYVDEALFKAGLHPRLSPADLSRDDLYRLFRCAKSVLRLAIRHGGTTFLNFANFHGKPGNFRRKLRVYQRTGKSCGNCGTTIDRVTIAGRSSHFCPRCQPR